MHFYLTEDLVAFCTKDPERHWTDYADIQFRPQPNYHSDWWPSYPSNWRLSFWLNEQKAQILFWPKTRFSLDRWPSYCFDQRPGYLSKAQFLLVPVPKTQLLWMKGPIFLYYLYQQPSLSLDRRPSYCFDQRSNFSLDRWPVTVSTKDPVIISTEHSVSSYSSDFW